MSKVPAIVSIQSMVAQGFVGNGAVVAGMLHCAVQPLPIPTVYYGAHGAIRPRRGGEVPATLFYQLLKALENREIDFLLSGFLGSPRQGEILAKWLEHRKDLPYLLDPVLGDDPQGLYVSPEVVEVVREKLLPRADYITPNPFELMVLAENETAPLPEEAAPRDCATLFQGAQKLLAQGPSWVIVTSWRKDRNEQTLYNLLLHREGAWEVAVKAVPKKAFGTGDLFAAILASALSRSFSVRQAGAAAALAVAQSLQIAALQNADTVIPVGLRTDLFDETNYEQYGISVTPLGKEAYSTDG
ncbi:pyridoxal kinase [Heliorestis convoluta]|uniref:pyridoxal kinase n=2 Tax=Heliorestis convoluta TaxID=356322 RepID=A0A5Q2N0X6_9FIRM|nr:pyridoxal kinase [Heliorestis convoluta]